MSASGNRHLSARCTTITPANGNPITFSGATASFGRARSSWSMQAKERIAMETLEGQKVVVTGGSRGLGLGIVEALVAEKARVTVVARDAERLANVSKRLGVDVIRGDVTEETVARGVLRDVRPSVLVLNAGAKPATGLIHELTWEGF